MDELKITESIRQNLLSATKWIKFFSVLGAISIGFMIILAISILFDSKSGMVGKTMGFICCMAGVIIYYLPVKKCFELIKNTKKAMNNASQNDLELCAKNLHWILKYCGIWAIVCLSINILIFIVAMIGLACHIIRLD